MRRQYNSRHVQLNDTCIENEIDCIHRTTRMSTIYCIILLYMTDTVFDYRDKCHTILTDKYIHHLYTK